MACNTVDAEHQMLPLAVAVVDCLVPLKQLKQVISQSCIGAEKEEEVDVAALSAGPAALICLLVTTQCSDYSLQYYSLNAGPCKPSAKTHNPPQVVVSSSTRLRLADLPGAHLLRLQSEPGWR